MPALDATARRYPDDIETKVQLGDALVKTGHPEQAVGYFNEVLAKQPDHLYALHSLGHALFILRRYQEAIVPLHHRVQLAPEVVGHHADLGWALTCAGRTAEGLAAFEEAVRLDPTREEAAYLRLHRQLECQFSAFTDTTEQIREALPKGMHGANVVPKHRDTP